MTITVIPCHQGYYGRTRADPLHEIRIGMPTRFYGMNVYFQRMFFKWTIDYTSDTSFEFKAIRWFFYDCVPFCCVTHRSHVTYATVPG